MTLSERKVKRSRKSKKSHAFELHIEPLSAQDKVDQGAGTDKLRPPGSGGKYKLSISLMKAIRQSSEGFAQHY